MPRLAVLKRTLCSEMDALYADLKLELAGRAPLAALFPESSEMTCIIFFFFLLLYSNASPLPRWERLASSRLHWMKYVQYFHIIAFPFVVAVQYVFAVCCFLEALVREEKCVSREIKHGHVVF